MVILFQKYFMFLVSAILEAPPTVKEWICNFSQLYANFTHCMYKQIFMLNICIGANKPEGLVVHFCNNLVLLWLQPHINANVCSQVFI